MVEAFAAEHKVTINELLYEWPATKFQALYAAFAKRKIADELAERRSMEMAAVWGNMNYDSQENPEIRQKIMGVIDKQYSTAIDVLYGAIPPEQAVEIDEDDPFWKAMTRGKEKYKLDENG